MHEIFMRRCLELAKNGTGNVSPNPLVGSVIVYEGKIIGEGYHRRYGEAHAEVNAINSVKDKSLLSKSTIYVNLEPCAHHGKTPPCAELIASLKIKNVVIGCKDTFSKVSGKGIEILRNAGLNVTVGVLEEESRYLNRRFFTYHEQKRPYVILKWAQTIDGYIDIMRPPETDLQPYWITNDYARRIVHKMRCVEDAIMVGTHTAQKDNPKLNIREWSGSNPVRVVIDRELRLNHDLFLFDGSVKTIVITDEAFNYEKCAVRDNIIYEPIDFESNVQAQILDILYNHNIQSVIIEGGAITINNFIREGLWDEAHVFVGNNWFGQGVKAPILGYRPKREIMIEDSLLLIFEKNDFSNKL